jgi:hypothetical protein
MLARYQIIRGKRPPDKPLPAGLRQDTRKHTNHILRPDTEAVQRYLENPTATAWKTFKASYLDLLEKRIKNDLSLFDKLADQALVEDVNLGCNCPTQANPDVSHCHTVLALTFMKKRYPKLKVQFP